MGLKIRRRARLRRKEVTDLVSRLSDEFGMTIPIDDVPIDEAEAGPQRLVLRGGEPVALVVGDGVAPTGRGLLAFPATKRAVTVDMGAVRVVYHGGGVMAPRGTEAAAGSREGG